MRELILEAGWPIGGVVLLGAMTIGLALSHARAPAPEKLRMLVSIAIATVLWGAAGTAISLQHSAAHVAELAPDRRWIFVIGLRESLHNLVLALSAVTIASMIHAFSTRASALHAQRRSSAPRS